MHIQAYTIVSDGYMPQLEIGINWNKLLQWMEHAF